jgi:hypothetical protein
VTRASRDRRVSREIRAFRAPQGDQGFQGTQGFQGDQGFQGNNGEGTQGTQGDQGTQGTQGFQGDQGFQGNNGEGTQGSQGDQGFQGTQGFQGDQGFQGNNGEGTQGSQGDQGTQGTQGFQGDQGFQGNNGEGTQGSQGDQGFQGTQGFQGDQGFQGNNGEGTQGTQGFQGDQGFQGNNGEGTQGTQGFQGDQGFQGNNGEGTQGTQGFQGDQGFQGNNGEGTQGTQGFQGDQGFQGNNGEGFQGTQGFQGDQGYQGNSGSSESIPVGLAVLSNQINPPSGFYNTGLILNPSMAGRSLALKASMQVNRIWAATAAVNGSVYSIGGSPYQNVIDGDSNINQQYDPAQNAWSQRARMRVPRSAAAVAVFNNEIYVFGGIFSAQYGTAKAEKYNPYTDSWTDLADMRLNTVGGLAVTVGSQIYVFGGSTDQFYCILQVYNIDSNSWNDPIRTNLPKFGGGGGVYIANRIYLLSCNPDFFGLPSAPPIFGYYDLATQQAKTIPLPSVFGPYLAAVAYLNDKIYVLGGMSADGRTRSDISVFDWNTQTWVSNSVAMANAVVGHGAAAVGNTIYVTGGGNSLSGQALPYNQSTEDNIFYLMRKQ